MGVGGGSSKGWPRVLWEPVDVRDSIIILMVDFYPTLASNSNTSTLGG